MAEQCLLLLENLGALMTMTESVAGVSGYEASKALDNYHHTYYKPADFAFSAGTEYDQSGRGFNATLFNTPVRGNYFGEANDGLQFLSASSQYGTFSDNDFGYVHTIEATIDITPTGTHVIISKDYGGGLYAYVAVDATNIIYQINNGANNYQKTQAHGGLTAGTPKKILVGRNGRYVSFWMNGVQLGAEQDFGTGGGLPTVTFTANTIGRLAASSYWNGKLSKIRVYNYYATAAQVAAQWASGGINSKTIYNFGMGCYLQIECNGAKPYTFSFDPVSAVPVNCVVMDTIMNDPQGHILLQINSTRYCWSHYDYLQKGLYGVDNSPTVIKWADEITIGIGNVALVTMWAQSTPKVRHLWLGVAKFVDPPNAPFDPLKELQPHIVFDNENGVVTKKTIKYTKRLLSAQFSNVQGTNYTNFQSLHDKCYKKGLPFWFFLLPTTNPRMGHLYEIVMENWDFPYQTGLIRDLPLEAIADYTPDRTTATL